MLNHRILRALILAPVFLTTVIVAARFSWAQRGSALTPAPSQSKDRVRVVIEKPLPHFQGDHLKAVLVEVNYAPGEGSPPHSHPCAVIGYVVEGALRTKVDGEPEHIYKPGESFYEAPNGVHLVSANASATETTRLLAYMICDHEAPLSVEVPKEMSWKGAPQ